jgi:23S rRNA (uracil1939-C5)-methyltransferase
VIVDPPRRGLDAPLLAALVQSPPPALIYVACGLASFQRDAAALTEKGAFKLVELAAGDLFPYTDHVEVIARFEQNSQR